MNFGMEKEKSLETGLLRKNRSIRERENSDDDVLVEAELPRKSSREVKIPENDNDGCRITATVLFSTFVAVFGSFCTGCGAGFSSGAQAGIMKDLSLSVAQYSFFGSIMTLGGLIGAVFSGKLADVLGRKRMMLFCEVFCTTGWLAVAFAQDALWLYCGRLLLGIGVGLFSYVIPVYVAEIAPKHVRGSFVNASQLMLNSGVSFFFIIGNFIPWRLLSIVGFVPCLLHVICLLFIPESPRWLAKLGRDKDCRSALQSIRGSDVDISHEANTIRENLEIAEKDGESGMTELLQKRYAYPLLIGVGLMILQQLCGSAGVTLYASSLFQKGGFSSTIGTSVVAIIMVPKAFLGTVLVDKMGRRTLLMASCFAMGLSALLLSVSYGFESHGILPDVAPVLTFIGVLCHIVTYAMGLGGLPWIIMAEIFPMNVKVSAGTLVTVTNWLFCWFVTYAFNFILEWNASGLFFIFSMVSASSIVFVYLLVPETKGRSLEEIQELLTAYVQ